MTENNPTPSKVQSLYVALRNKGLSEEQLGSFEDFHQGMTDEKARARLYDGLSKLNIKAGKSFDEFNSRLTQFYEDDRQAAKSTAREAIGQTRQEIADVTNQAVRGASEAIGRPAEETPWGVPIQPIAKSMAEAEWYEAEKKKRGAISTPQSIAIEKELTRAEKTLDAPEKKDVQGVIGATKAFGQGLTSMEVEQYLPYVSGISEAAHQKTLADLSAKIEAGHPMTLAESLLAKSAGLNTQAQSVSDVSNWYSGGQTTGAMLPFMGEMAATAGVGGAASKMVQAGLKARNVLQGTNIASKIARGTIKSLSYATAQTPLQSMLYSEYERNKAGQYSLSVNPESGEIAGELVPGSVQSDPKAAYNAFTSTLMETWSEGLGEYGPKFVAKMIDKAGTSKGAKLLTTTFRKAAKFDGPVWEIGEEYFNALGIAALQGDTEQLEQMFTKYGFIQTAIPVAVVSGAFKVLEAGEKTAVRLNIRSNLSRAEKDMQGLDVEQRNQVIQAATLMRERPDEAQAMLNGIGPALNTQQKVAVVKYMAAKLQSDLFNKMNEEDKANHLQQSVAQAVAESRTMQHRDGNYYQVTDKEGIPYYVIGGDMSRTPSIDNPIVVVDGEGNRKMITEPVTVARKMTKEQHDAYLYDSIAGMQQQQEAELEQVDAEAAEQAQVEAKIAEEAAKRQILPGMKVEFNGQKATVQHISIQGAALEDEEGNLIVVPPTDIKQIKFDKEATRKAAIEMLEDKFGVTINENIDTGNGNPTVDITPNPTITDPDMQLLNTQKVEELLAQEGIKVRNSVVKPIPAAPEATPATQPELPEELPPPPANVVNMGDGTMKPTEQASEQTQAAPAQSPSFPTNKQGEIQYDQINDPTIFAQALTQEFGEEAGAVADELLAEQTKLLKKAQANTNPIDRRRKSKAVQTQIDKLTTAKKLIANEQQPDPRPSQPVNQDVQPVAGTPEAGAVAPEAGAEPEKRSFTDLTEEQKKRPKRRTGAQRKVEDMEFDGDPVGFAMQFMSNMGALHMSAIEELFTIHKGRETFVSPGELAARTFWVNRKGGGMTIDQIAHHLWESQPEGMDVPSDEYRNIVADIIIGHKTPAGIARALIERGVKAVGKGENMEQNEDFANFLAQEEKRQEALFDEVFALTMQELERTGKLITDEEYLSLFLQDDNSIYYDEGTSTSGTAGASGQAIGNDGNEQGRSSRNDEGAVDPQSENGNEAEAGSGAGDEPGDEKGSGIAPQPVFEIDGQWFNFAEHTPGKWWLYQYYEDRWQPIPNTADEIREQEIASQHLANLPDGYELIPPFETEQAEEQPKANTVIDHITAAEINDQAAQADPNPSDAQKEAGNYKHGHTNVQGFDISIENAAGSIRSGRDSDGEEWMVEMQNHYGYFTRTEGKDGDQIDCFIGDNPVTGKIFIVDQINPDTGEFDEHKVMIGFNNIEEAADAYYSNYSQGWKGLGAITEMPHAEFKEWLKDGTRTKEPVAYNNRNQEEVSNNDIVQNTETEEKNQEVLGSLDEANKEAIERKDRRSQLNAEIETMKAKVARKQSEHDRLKKAYDEAKKSKQVAIPIEGTNAGKLQALVFDDQADVEKEAAQKLRAVQREIDGMNQQIKSLQEQHDALDIDGKLGAQADLFSPQEAQQPVSDALPKETKEDETKPKVEQPLSPNSPEAPDGQKQPSAQKPQAERELKNKVGQGSKQVVDNNTPNRIPVIGIGDLHGENPEQLKSDLIKVGIINEAGDWITDKTIVQVGDVTDRGQYSEQLIDFLSELQKKAGGKIVRILGNHDLAHLMRKAESVGGVPNEMITVKLREGVLDGSIVAAWSEGDTIYTHAGIDLNVFDEYYKETLTPAQIAKNLNEILIQAVKTNNFNHKIFSNDGIFWTRRDIENDQFRQVVGHTVKSKQHTYKDGDRVKYIDTGRVFGGSRDLMQNTVANKPIKPRLPADYGKKNTVVKEEAKNEALERLRKKRGNLNTGIDPQDFMDGITVACYHVEAGLRKFSEWAAAMLEDVGEWARPYLKSWYNGVRDYPGMEQYESDMTPYDQVKSFDLTTIPKSTTFDEEPLKKEEDVSDRSGDSEQDRKDGADEVPHDDNNVHGDGGTGRRDGSKDQSRRGKGNGGRSGGKGGSGLFTSIFGESSDNEVHSPDKEPIPPVDNAGDFDGRGNGVDGSTGYDVSDEETNDTDSEIGGGVSQSFKQRLDAAIKKQREVEGTPVVLMDKANIRETLPVLLPEQQDDVAKAEERFFAEKHQTKQLAFGKGMLFTNGTGTGKTFTGLGIIKRFVKSGKKNILIVVPSEAKINDWIKEGAYLGMDVTAIQNLKDKGVGVRVTTYAMFQASEGLPQEDFDLVVFDESHRIMDNNKGEASGTTKAFQGAANVSESDAYARITSVHPVWVEHRELFEQYTQANKNFNSNLDLMDWQVEERRSEIKKLDEKLKVLESEKEKLKPALKERAKKAYENTKVVLLSATPFKSVFNLRYANGVLFDWGNETTYEQASRGSSRVHPEGRFFLDHFGAMFEWKYHKLQSKSKANAEAIAMQEVEFANKLIRDGVMSGRAIESNMDYSREFPVVALGGADKINEAFAAIFNYSDGAKYDGLREAARAVFFSYEYATQLFESLRAEMMLPRIEKHLAMGRKVVVFHRRRQSKATAPFATVLNEASASAKAVLSESKDGRITYSKEEIQKAHDVLAQVEAFKSEYAELLAYEQTLSYASAVDQLQAKFGDQVVTLNGTTKNSDKPKVIEAFNNDDSGKNIIVIQEEAGKEGISLHDKTGKHQRVLVSLSIPISSTTALQVEGRIYRIGQETDAIFEYPMLGLDMEIMAFGQKVNKKLSTTENLAVGDKSRDLLRSFAEGVLFNATKNDPSENQGKGGKEADKREQQSVSLFQKAVLVYHSNQKKRGRRDERDGVDYYATPEPVGQKMVEWLDLGPADSVLEPSAGHGAISMWFPEDSNATVIEPSYKLFSKLGVRTTAGNTKLLNSTFESLNVVNKYDGIVMNPPFGSGGALAAEHVAKAFSHLKTGGRIVALIPVGSMDKRMDKFFEENPSAKLVAEIKMPSVTFEQAGTAVNTRIVVIDKTELKTKSEIKAEVYDRAITDPSLQTKEQVDAEVTRLFNQQAADNIGYVERHNISSTKTIDELFDNIEGISIPDRTRAEVAAEPGSETAETKQTEDYKAETVKHTKTGEAMHIVKMVKRLTRDEYVSVAKKADKYGGYYNKFIGAFHFKGDKAIENRAKFIDEVFGETTPDAPRFSLERETPTHPTIHDAKIDALRDLSEKAQNARPTFVSGTYEDLMAQMGANNEPAAFIKAVLEQIAMGNKIQAFMGQHGVYFVAKNINDASQARKLWIHEQGTHVGLRLLFNDAKALDTFLNKVFNMLGEETIMEAFGGVLQSYVRRDKAGNITNKAELAEEYMARLSEKVVDGTDLSAKEKTIWSWLRDRLMNLIRKFANDEIKFKSQAEADRFLSEIIRQSVREVVGSKPNPQTTNVPYSAAQPNKARTVGEYLTDPQFSLGKKSKKEQEDAKTPYQKESYDPANRNGLPEGVSFVSEPTLANINGQISLWEERDYTPGDSNRLKDEVFSERFIDELKGVNFQGSPITGFLKITNSADVAYLFKNLEKAATENAFAVLIKPNGGYQVLWVSHGSTSGTILDTKLILAAAKDFGSDIVAFVHNHPSGNLTKSNADVAAWKKLRDALEINGIGLAPGIVINLDSGKYLEFTDDDSELNDTIKETNRKTSKVKVFGFDRQELYRPSSERTQIRSSRDVALYLSKAKRGTTPKIGALVLNRANEVMKAMLFDETISTDELTKSLMYEVSKHGDTVILHSNTKINPADVRKINAAMKTIDSTVLDVIQSEQGKDVIDAYKSFADDGLLEPQAEYISSSPTKLPKTIEVDGKQRPTTNSNGQPIHPTEEGVRNFYRWFGESKVVDGAGRPLVVYHGTPNGGFNYFSKETKGTRTNHSPEDVGFHFTDDKDYASTYSLEYRKIAYPALMETLGYIPEASKAPDNAMTYQVYLSIKNPTNVGYANAINKIVIEKAQENGYDGIIGEIGEVLEYVVFSPTQIKSATANDGTFDGQNPDIRFAILGEKGAASLDKAEEATTRMDNLKVAREMEAANKDAKTIRLATGWERGKDGLWRYEVPDGKLLTSEFIREKRPIRGAESLLYRGVESQLPYTDESPFDKLENIWNDVELYKAYPQIRNIRVFAEINSEFPSGNGSYSGKDKGNYGNGFIKAYAPSNDALKSILLHEIQHAIQDIEGFAKGGSVEQFKLSNELNELFSKQQEKFAEDFGFNYWLDEVLFNNMDLFNSLLEQGKEGYTLKPIYEEFAKLLPEGDKSYFVNRMLKFDSDKDKNKKRDAQEAYSRLSGEVEARNVQSRLNLTDQQRRETLLAETEDVAREDQIVLMDAIGEQKSETGDIRFSIAPDMADHEDDKEWVKSNNTNRIIKRQLFQDNMIIGQRLIDEFKARGGKTNELTDFVSEHNKQNSRSMFEIRQYDEKYFKPMLEAIAAVVKKHDLTVTELNDYLLAKHSIERHDAGVSALSEEPGTEWSREYVQSLVDAFEAKVPEAEREQMYAAIRKATMYSIEKLYSTGTMLPETYERIRDQYQYYVPLRDWAKPEEDKYPDEIFGYTNPSSRYTKHNSPLKTAKGRMSKSEDPLGFIQSLAHSAITFGNKNEVRRAALRLLQANKDEHQTWPLAWQKKVWYVREPGGVWEETLEKPSAEKIAASKEAKAEYKRLARKLKRAEKNGEETDVLETIAAEMEMVGENITVESRVLAPHAARKPYHLGVQHEVEVFDNGVKHIMVFADPRIAEALNGMDMYWNVSAFGKKLFSLEQGTASVLSRAIGRPTRWLTQNFTAKNPAFIPVNWIRDYSYALTSHLIRDTNYVLGGKWLNPDARQEKGNIAGFIRNTPVASRAIHRYQQRTWNPVEDEMEQMTLADKAGRNAFIAKYGKKRYEDTMYMIWMKGGGETGYVHMKTPDQLKLDAINDLNKLLGKRTKGDYSKGKVKAVATDVKSSIEMIGEKAYINAVLKHSGHALNYLANMSENMSRFATFMASMEDGKTFGQATMDSKNITTNFNRRGRATAFIAPLYGFVNANIQGGHNLLHLAKHNIGIFSAVAATFMVSGAMAAEMVMALIGDDDEKDIPDYVLLNNIVIPTGGGDYISIPIMPGFRMFWAAGVLAAQAINGKKSMGDVAFKTTNSIAESFSPFTINESEWEKGQFPARAFIPTAMVPAYDIATNSDFTGKPIERKRWNEYTPDSELGMRRTSEAFKTLATTMNKLAGGDETRSAIYSIRPDGSIEKAKGVEAAVKNMADFNPSVMEHVLLYYAGGRGRFFNDVRVSVGKLLQGEAPETYQIPVIKRLYGSAWDYETSDKWFEYGDFVAGNKLFRKKAEAAENYELADKLTGSEKTNELIDVYDYYKKEMDDLEDEIDAETDEKAKKELLKERATLMGEAVKDMDAINDKYKK